jgi:hypothetical protein
MPIRQWFATISELSRKDVEPSLTDKPDETVDASDWKSTLAYVLLAVLLVAVVFGVFYGVDALYYGE